MTETEELRRDLDALYRGLNSAMALAEAALTALDALAVFIPPEVAKYMSEHIDRALNHPDWRHRKESAGFIRLSRLRDDLRQTAEQQGIVADDTATPEKPRVELRLVRTIDPEPPQPPDGRPVSPE